VESRPEPLERLRSRLAGAQRSELLALLAAGVRELTIRARSFYDAPEAHDRMREINEAIHCVANHLHGFVDPGQALTASRVESIVAALGLLTPAALARLCEVAA
jgi:alkylhydroperoxidase family enzyme